MEMRAILLPHFRRLATAAGVSAALVEGCVRELSDFDPAAQLELHPDRVGLALMPAGGEDSDFERPKAKPRWVRP